MEFLKKITVEINKGTDRPIIAKQNDTARYLLFTIIEDNGVPFLLDKKKVRIYGVKPDNRKVFNECEIIDSKLGKVKVNLTSQMLLVPGMLNLELVIMEDKEIISTIPFEIEVIKSLRDTSSILSKNEYDILLSTINKGQTLEVSIKELIGEGNPLYTKLKPTVDEGKQLNINLSPKIDEGKEILSKLLKAIQDGNLDNFITKNGGTIEGRLNVGVNGKYLSIGVGNDDVAIQNTKSGKWLQLKDNGLLCYNNQKVYHEGNKPTPADIGASKIPSKEKLWSGAYVFTSGHKARLSKNIKDTPHGLRLKWGAYTGGEIRDYNYRTELIFKDESMFGKSQLLLMADTGGNLVTKTVYVSDNGMSLVGHDDNGRGNNSGMVLREIKEF